MKNENKKQVNIGLVIGAGTTSCPIEINDTKKEKKPTEPLFKEIFYENGVPQF